MRVTNGRRVFFTWTGPARRGAALMAGAIAALALAGPGCSQPRQAKKVEPVVRDVPAVLRGTIGAETTFRGIEPQLVSDFGIVVGLNGTGGGELPESIQATMERELARGGVGKGSPGNLGPLEGVTPKEFLRDTSVAVVIVEAAIPPGAPKASTFEVRVRTLPGSTVTSLEGGTLWTTDLRIGPATVFTGVKSRKIAEAHGPIFVNPFAEPGKSGEDAIGRTVGRVLAGGVVTDPLQLELVLDNESHARARSIQEAIRYRFPEGPGDDGPIVRGRSGGSLALRVPRAYTDRPAEFIELVRHTRIEQVMAQEYARRYVEELKNQPALATDIGWCLRALGKVSVPFLLPMYDYPELVPRMAALEAGAKLDDVRAVPYLEDLAMSGPPGFQAAAIELLGGMRSNPRINEALRHLVNAPDLDVRVSAYEALAERGDPMIERVVMGDDPTQPKFMIDTVPANDAMIYVTQRGQPRIVLFGSSSDLSPGGAPGSLSLAPEAMVSAWSDRLMVARDPGIARVRVLYRDARSGQKTEQSLGPTLAELIRFLAHKPTPEDPAPGLNLTYSEVVGALYEIQRQGGVPATFATERDRMAAAIYEAGTASLADRPENSAAAGAGQDVNVFVPRKPAMAGPAAGEGQGPAGRPSLVVPISPKTPAGGKKNKAS